MDKLEMCQGCHGGGMRMGMGWGETAPKLGGQHAAYLEKALRAYRSGARAHPVMSRMASMLTDREIGEIARFYASAGATR
jgi:cytochrome c553